MISPNISNLHFTHNYAFIESSILQSKRKLNNQLMAHAIPETHTQFSLDTNFRSIELVLNNLFNMHSGKLPVYCWGFKIYF